jgi:hypothetical protein
MEAVAAMAVAADAVMEAVVVRVQVPTRRAVVVVRGRMPQAVEPFREPMAKADAWAKAAADAMEAVPIATRIPIAITRVGAEGAEPGHNSSSGSF